jgi:hypothetical protein
MVTLARSETIPVDATIVDIGIAVRKLMCSDYKLVILLDDAKDRH